jgi:hypothetical protein
VQIKPDAPQSTAIGKHRPEIPGLTQPVLGAEAIFSRHPADSLNAQTMATFGTACTNHRTATTGAHANKKAMSTLAADDGRLVCAFH